MRLTRPKHSMEVRDMTATAVQYKYVTLSHGKTRYIESGTGHPLILLHASYFPSGADDWLPNINALAERFRVLAPDFVGWGLSDLLDQEYSFAYLTDFVREFQDALNLQSSHIVGASMGGWIAGIFAYESPDRVDRLVQSGHNGVSPKPNPRMANFEPPSDQALREWVLKVTQGSGVDGNAVAEERIRKMHEPGVVENFGMVMRHMTNMDTRHRYDLARRLPKITAPTLYIWGNKDASFPTAQIAHDLTPGSELLVFDCGHDVALEMPNEFNEAVMRFLSQG